MKSIVIKNYKNLKNFKIGSLSRVNLIVGKNNVGKSTLLEAISIYASKGDIGCLREILDIRGEVTRFSIDPENEIEKEIDSFCSLYRDRDMDAFLREPIQISSNSNVGLFDVEDTISIKLVKYIETRESSADGGFSINRQFMDSDAELNFATPDTFTGLLLLYNDKSKLYTFGRNKNLLNLNKEIPSEYVRTSQVSSARNPRLFDKIALTPLEEYIIRALKIIEPRIEAINFLKDWSYKRGFNGDNRVPFVVFAASTQRYKLGSMGDGVNRILTIILALINCKDGILLIDEFENGLHYSVQTQLWKMIFDLAERLDVQVFVTTHSDDCIKSFVETDNNQQGKLIRLENIDGNIGVVAFNDQDRLEFAINQNIEVR